MTVKPLVEVFEWLRSFEGRRVIKRANELCKVDQWDLTGETLTSPKARAALKRYLHTDDVLQKEIEGKLGAGCLDLDEDTGPEETDDTDLDDTDIPLCAVIQDTLNLDIQACITTGTQQFCVDALNVSH